MRALDNARLLAILREKRFALLAEWVDIHPATVRKLLSLLYADDPLDPWLAVLGLGELARTKPSVMKRVVSRLAWTLNDEASTCGWMSAAALGEMTAHNPDLTRDVVRIVVHYLEDEETCHGVNRNARVLCTVLWAVARVAVTCPDLAQEVLTTLVRCTTDPNGQVRGYAAWSLGWIKGGEKALEPLHMDRERVNIFDPREALFIDLEVGQWARWALAHGNTGILG